jgi:acetyl esterase/lipase
MVGGSSAGAGLAAGVVLRARGEGEIAICRQLLIHPMLDDRKETESNRRCTDDRIWGRDSNIWAWKGLLGEGNGIEGVSQYIAPARAKDLSSLPPTFVCEKANQSLSRKSIFTTQPPRFQST